MAYMHGNLAIDHSYEQQNVQKRNVRERKKVIVRKNTISAREKLLYLFTIVLCVVIAGIVIFRYAQIYEINTKIQQIERDIQRLEAENQSLKLTIRKLQEPKRLLELSESLGFHPDLVNEPKQIVTGPNRVPKSESNIAFLE